MKLTQLAVAVLMASGTMSAVAATYSVTPLPVKSIAKHNYARSIDNSGAMLTATQLEYNPPIDLERLDDGTFYDNNTLESEEDVKQGIFSNIDYTTIVNYLLNNRGYTSVQQLASYRSYITDSVSYDLVPGFDELTDKFDDYTHSVVTIARDSLDGDYIVGTSEGLYLELDYTNQNDVDVTYTYNEMSQQAFVEVGGVSKRLAPTDTTLGGISEAFAVNSNLQVAGYGTVSFLQESTDSVTALPERIAACDDEETRGDIPLEICYRNIRSNNSYFLYQSQMLAHIWQLDANGNVLSTTTYPLVFTPEEDDILHYFTYAYDINNNGVAVGESLTGETPVITRPESNAVRESGRVATIFENGETVEFLPRDENLQSAASGINDNNWITGYVLRAPNQIARQRLFVYNKETGEARYPEGFFLSSGVDANAINNNNIVVGKADVEASTEKTRETHAFMYNIDTDEFVDLNDLISCDNEYTLLEAVDINDDNEIIANARIHEPATYITGEEIIDAEGQTSMTYDIKAVKLSPITNGSIETCEVVEDEAYKRKGATLSAWWLALLAGLVAFRRRKNL